MKCHSSIRIDRQLFLIICFLIYSGVSEAQENPNQYETPDWMTKAVLYEITPYSFVKNRTFRDITDKIPDLNELGINTIWLQPVIKSARRGQGYDVVDYFAVNPDLGTEEELYQLVDTAKNLGMRVLFDVVLNHTSIEHPYAKDVIKNGAKSYYYNYYQPEVDGHSARWLLLER